ncbi:DUF4328 domain-containing protein [Risungbinella massiliensis]|uniref:DUF4328 domain-containing protein n=1 Tax=Risungbinella massiliensis TaxID=1329796 RepID=UPI0005CC6C9C|nr:DUF4328 domain-containing protein [Risungbinella massiliensis]
MWLVYRENERVIRSVKISIVVHFMFCVCALIYDIQFWYYAEETTPAKHMVGVEFYHFIHLVRWISIIPMLWIYLHWLKRITANIGIWSKLPTRIVGGKLDIYHLIPIIQMYKPFQALKDVSNALIAKKVTGHSACPNCFWGSLPAPPILIVFWSSLWSGVVLGIYAFFHMDSWLVYFTSKIGEIYQVQPLYYLVDLLWMFGTLCFYLLVNQISRAHLAELQESVLEQYDLDSAEELPS